jgi:hypothetical protein
LNAGFFDGNVVVTGKLFADGGPVTGGNGTLKSFARQLVPILLDAADVTGIKRSAAIAAADLVIDQL